jgi:hypothetical protein
MKEILKKTEKVKKTLCYMNLLLLIIDLHSAFSLTSYEKKRLHNFTSMLTPFFNN